MVSKRQTELEQCYDDVRKDAATCGLFRGLPGIKDISEDSFERKAKIMSSRLRCACRFAGHQFAELCLRKCLASSKNDMQGYGSKTINDRDRHRIAIATNFYASDVSCMILRGKKRCRPARGDPKQSCDVQGKGRHMSLCKTVHASYMYMLCMHICVML